jgi:hypothetical protein
VNIVPLFEIRSLAVPLVQNDDSSIPADEWISRIVTTSKKEARRWCRSRPSATGALIGNVRHLRARRANCTSCRQLIIVDRYANVQRISAIVKMLDQQ